MLKFDEKFFEEETRLGYVVDPLSKRNWAALLEVMTEIDRVCKKYGITYYADGGTLLGAVRHGGFIPWDDDVDIAMKREDYQRFQDILSLEFLDFEKHNEDDLRSEKLFYFSPVKGEKNVDFKTVICSNNTIINLKEEHLTRYHGYPYAAAVDVFPLDYFPEVTKDIDLIFRIIEILENIVFIEDNWKNEQEPSNSDVIGVLKQVEEMIGHKFDYSRHLRKQALILIDNLSKSCREDESKYIICAPWYSFHRELDQKFLKEWYDEIEYMSFENIMVPVPKEYDNVLTALYGDYMTPIYQDGHGNKAFDILKDNMVDFEEKELKESILETASRYK